MGREFSNTQSEASLEMVSKCNTHNNRLCHVKGYEELCLNGVSCAHCCLRSLRLERCDTEVKSGLKPRIFLFAILCHTHPSIFENKRLKPVALPLPFLMIKPLMTQNGFPRCEELKLV